MKFHSTLVILLGLTLWSSSLCVNTAMKKFLNATESAGDKKKSDDKKESKPEAKKESKPEAKKESKSEEKKEVPKTNNQTNGTSEKEAPSQIITKAPFNVTSCKQVIQITTKTLSNYGDFTSKNKEIFFTMSAMLVNLFENKSSNKLLESINLSSISEFPRLLRGSKTCISFTDDNSFRNITICPETEDERNSLSDAYKKFIDCRGGLSLTKQEQTEVIKASCNGISRPDGSQFDFLEAQNIWKEEWNKKGLQFKNEGLNGDQVQSILNHTPIDSKNTTKLREIASKNERYWKMRKFIVPGTIQPDI